MKIEQIVKLNKFLRFLFIVIAVSFLVMYLTTPKTDCQACKIKYKDKTINGYKAFELFENACISYIKPHTEQEFYVDIDDINISDNGLMTWDTRNELTREDVDNLTP